MAKIFARPMKNKEVILSLTEGTLFYLRNHPTLAAKYLFNIKLNWVQRLSLRAIWFVPFVMLIWGRRCMSENTHIIMADGSWKYLKDINIGDKVLSWNGNDFIEDIVIDKVNTGIKKVNKIKTFGFKETLSTDDHWFFVSCIDGKPKYKKFKDINEYEGFLTYPEIKFSRKKHKYLAEFIGHFITDGTCTEIQTPKYTNIKKELIDRVKYLVRKIFKYECLISNKGNGFDLFFSDGNKGTQNTVKSFLRQYNLVCNKKDRRVPDILWKLDKESVLSFFSGVLAGDGNIYNYENENNSKFAKTSEIKISVGDSELLAWDYYWLLRKIGICSTAVKKDYREDHNCWYVIIYKSSDINKLLSSIRIIGKEENQNRALEITKNRKSRKRLKNSFFRIKFKKKSEEYSTCYDITTMINHNFIADGFIVHNCGKTYIGSVATVLIALLFPNEKVLIVCPSKRQVDWIFLNEINNLYVNSDYFKGSVIGKISITNAYNRIKFTNGSTIEGYPVGSEGNRVRGAGATFLWVDEYASMSESVINLVFRPMLSVKKKGQFNRYLITSSAYYRWNHLWNLFQYYKIKSIIDSKKYQVFNFNYEHLLLSDNLPVEFDMNIIEEARNNMTESEFKMEFLACLKAGTKISTNKGIKNIEEIQNGDLVLTHNGNYKKVISIFKRMINEEIIKIKPYYFDDIYITKEHKVFINRNNNYIWEKAENVLNNDFLVYPLNKYNNNKLFDLIEYTYNYDKQVINNIEYIYPSWSSKTGTDNKYCKKYMQIRRNSKLYKSSIKRYIYLTPDFARLFGYYLAEGSIGAKGKSISFAFNKKEINYIDDVLWLVENIFGIKGILYLSKKDGGCSVIFCSRILVDFFKNIIPGNCYTKKIPEFIFESNNEIIKNLLIGYINGDGCITLRANGNTKDIANVTSSSLDLILGVNDLFSKLGIKTSYYIKKEHKQIFKKRIVNCSISYKLNIKGDGLRRLLEFYNLKDSTILKKNTYNFMDKNYLYYRIKNIYKENLCGYVYNLEVEDDNSYVANYAIVHNCFPINIEGFFSSQLIDKSTPKPPDYKPIEIELKGDGTSDYFMGVDVGRAEGGSNFSISVVKRKNKKGSIVNIITANGATFQDMTEMVRRKFLDFGVRKIKIDAGGGGTTLKDLLREPWSDAYTHKSYKPLVTLDDTINGIPILEMIKFTDEIHNNLYMNLKSEMEHSRLLFPLDLRRDENKELERAGQEIVAFKNELRVTTANPKGKYLRFEVPNRFRNDRIISTALAVDAYLEVARNEYSDDLEMATGFWI